MDENNLTPYPPKIKHIMDIEFNNLMNEIKADSSIGGKKSIKKTHIKTKKTQKKQKKY